MNNRMLLASFVPSIGLWLAIHWAMHRLQLLPASLFGFQLY